MGNTGAGVLSGVNPFVFDAGTPLPTFIIQMLIILCTCRLIKFILSPLKQPAVIAEIIGGIILGPTALGRIPGYMDAIFPKASLPFLNLMSNFGLVLFLFLVGMELDPRMLKQSIKRSFSISLGGMALPFGIGAAVSYALYTLVEPEEHKKDFGVYLLFLGVALSITAFPVLARILTELDLLKTKVGSITISAAAVDDATSWCLLALVISLLNAGSGLTALYVFLLGVAYCVILVLAVRPVFLIICRKSGAFENGPNQFIVFLTLSLVFVSAFITEAIGIHAIFGGFVMGIIIPHEGGFARHMTEKIEDLVTVMFLPLYFALSGLKTQIGALNDGLSWGMVVLVIACACIGKIVGCTLTARLTKLNWRESLAVGVLMNCKGLVELIVLNLGLDAGVISSKTFAIMVIMALVTTFLTVPLVNIIYPKSYHTSSQDHEGGKNPAAEITKDDTTSSKVLVCLNKLEHVPAIMTLVQLLQSGLSPIIPASSKSEEANQNTNLVKCPLSITALRLIELTERNSDIMKYSESDETLRLDPVIGVFRTFSHLSDAAFKTILKVVNPYEFADSIIATSNEINPKLILVPWNGSGTIVDSGVSSPLEKAFNSPVQENTYTSSQHASFVRDLFRQSTSQVAVLVDRGLGSVSNHQATNSHSFTQNIFIPFYGGKDDRAALILVLGMAHYHKVNLTIVRYSVLGDVNRSETTNHETYHPAANTQDILHSDQSDELLLNQLFGSDRKQLPYGLNHINVNYSEVESSSPIASALETLQKLSQRDMVVVGRGKIGSLSSIYGSGVKRVDNERRRVLGDVAESILLSQCPSSVLVVQDVKN